MDIADACSEEIYAEISDLCALFRISALAHADNAILFAADSADLCLDGHALLMSLGNELLCLSDVLLDRKSGAVEHDGCEASVDALVAAIICAVIQMQSNRNCDIL